VKEADFWHMFQEGLQGAYILNRCGSPWLLVSYSIKYISSEDSWSFSIGGGNWRELQNV
jgi:hypothetical protein